MCIIVHGYSRQQNIIIIKKSVECAKTGLHTPHSSFIEV